MDIEVIRKNIEFAIANYTNPENREAVYNALHRIQAEVVPRSINYTDESGD